MSKHKPRQRRSFTQEFKAEAVELVRLTGKSVAQVARDLDLTESALYEWVKKAEGREPRPPGSSGESEELRRLREENRVLKMERDFLKKAAAFFAKESK